MKNILKEIALYLLVATVLLNLTVNIVQNKTEDTLLKISIEQVKNGEEVNKVLDEIVDVLEIQEKLLTNYHINLTILNRITKPQQEPNFQKLLTATVEITTLGRGGAGICINQDEKYYYILTAQHVVATRLGNVISVRTRDKFIYAGEIMQEDPDADLALVRVGKWDTMQLSVVKLAINEPKIKDRVFIVGHPLKAFWTITEGIVSNTNVLSYIMTTAVTTYGNSGGGLFNTDGDVIGICSKVAGYMDGVPESGMGLSVRLSVIKEFLKSNSEVN